MPRLSRGAGSLVAGALFLGLAVFVTWPFVLHPTSTIPALIGGDVSISISKFAVLAREDVNPFTDSLMRSVGWPDGVATTPGLDLVSFLSTIYLLGGAETIGSIATHSLMGLLGHTLTALVTFLFVREATGSAKAGFVAGIAYGFASHLFIVVWAAVTYSHMWLFVLPMWAAWRLAMAPSPRRALLAGAATLPAIFWTPYYAAHVTAVGAASLLVVLLVLRRDRIKLGALAALPWVLGVVAYLGIGVITSFGDVPERAESDRFDQSAHPLMYLVPGAFARFWGSGPSDWLTGQVPRAASINLYLGVSVLLLGLVAVWFVLRPWIRRRAADGPAVAAMMGLSVAVTCFAFSLPPKVWGSRIPTPSQIIFAIEPAIRAGQRFVMPLMAGTAVLAGVGAWWLLKRLEGRPPLALAATALLAAVVFVDIAVKPPESWVRTPGASPALAALRKAPDGPAIHYMYNGFLDSPAPRACFVQRQHDKPLANACAILLERSPRLVEWSNMAICDALRAEREAGIRYVIADTGRQDIHDCFTSGQVGDWRYVGTDDQLAVVAFES